MIKYIKYIKNVVVLGLIVLLTSCSEPKRYTLEIIFCDNREKITITHYSCCKPSNSNIYTSEQAVPIFFVHDKDGNGQKLLNVCDITVVN